jgi:hypothetical protein
MQNTKMTTTEETPKTEIFTETKKRKDHAFGKDVYLLGWDKYHEQIWLEAASWDCGWYWGFGYVETYTGKNPSTSRDINSHSHFDGLVGFKTADNKYIAHLNESPEMSATVLSDRESWELCDLMSSFYTLKKAAEIFRQGNSHLTSTTNADLKSEETVKLINETLLPRIFARVYEILDPNTETDLAG